MIALFVYIIVINLVAYHLYRIDKERARREAYRIPESVLLSVAFLGGALGSFCAMREYRHKTLHASFTVAVPLALVAQSALVVWAIVYCLMK